MIDEMTVPQNSCLICAQECEDAGMISIYQSEMLCGATNWCAFDYVNPHNLMEYLQTDQIYGKHSNPSADDSSLSQIRKPSDQQGHQLLVTKIDGRQLCPVLESDLATASSLTMQVPKSSSTKSKYTRNPLRPGMLKWNLKDTLIVCKWVLLFSSTQVSPTYANEKCPSLFCVKY